MKTILYIGNDLSSPGSLPTGVQTLAAKLRGEGFKVITASGKENQVLRLADMLRAVVEHRKSVDYVLIDTYSTWNFWYAYAVAKLCQQFKLRYIPILHGGELPKRLMTSPSASSAIFGNAFVNVVPSRFLLEEFWENELKAEETWGKRFLSNGESEGGFPVVHIPNSIELSDYAFRARTRLCPKLLWVRAFDSIYNPLQALQVLQELLPKYPEAELCMVGPEKDSSFEECQEYARNHQLPVSFPGRLEKQEWTALASDYDLFLNTTNIDNTPVSLIEAMALGLPVVSTNVGGLPYLVQHRSEGLLVPPNDPVIMARAVEQLLKNPSKAHQFALNAREKVEAFDWKQVREEWMELLR